jgi:hypothetical protein
MSEYTNIASNVIVPFDPRRTKLIMGSLEYIAAEVVVSKLVRKVMKADTKGWLQLAYIHALSLPFMGGAAGFFDESSGYTGTDSSGQAVNFTTNFMDGAKGIPAVIVAQYIIDSLSKGFHVPWFNLKDLLITAGCKSLTRPIVGLTYGYLPSNAQENLRVLEILFQRQQQSSTLS